MALALSQRFQGLQNRVSFLPPSLPWLKRRKICDLENDPHSWPGKPDVSLQAGHHWCFRIFFEGTVLGWSLAKWWFLVPCELSFWTG